MKIDKRTGGKLPVDHLWVWSFSLGDEEIDCRFWWSRYLGFSRSPSWLRLPLPAALPQTLKALSFTLSTVKTLSFLLLSLLKKTVFLSVWFLCPESSSFSVLFSSYLPLRFSLSPSPLFCSRSSSHSISLSLFFLFSFFLQPLTPLPTSLFSLSLASPVFF